MILKYRLPLISSLTNRKSGEVSRVGKLPVNALRGLAQLSIDSGISNGQLSAIELFRGCEGWLLVW